MLEVTFPRHGAVPARDETEETVRILEQEIPCPWNRSQVEAVVIAFNLNSEPESGNLHIDAFQQNLSQKSGFFFNKNLFVDAENLFSKADLRHGIHFSPVIRIFLPAGLPERVVVTEF